MGILAVLAYVAYTDFKKRIIPNWVTFSLIILGILYHIFVLKGSWRDVIFGVVTALINYVLHIWAEGDVKLWIGLSLCLSLPMMMALYVAYGFCLVCFGLIQMIKKKSFKIRLTYPVGVAFLVAYLLVAGAQIAFRVVA